ncbi:MAG: hypothetical protein Q7U04_02165 [Bacteriovorax sp.]|nr:hypothetical protein [Bacteriovorax sp.]
MKTKFLKKIGMNIFTSIKVSNLSQEILDIFKAQKIPYSLEDTLCILANGGKKFWEQLPHPLDKAMNPIDQFSLKQIVKIDRNAQILFPHSKWNIPLQKIGRLLNISRPSLLGIDINQNFGLWFAFRGAYFTKEIIDETKYQSFESPCNSCLEKPCQKACPASAISTCAESFILRRCLEYQTLTQSSCSDRCLARLSCPYQNQHQYTIEQIRYHQAKQLFL